MFSFKAVGNRLTPNTRSSLACLIRSAARICALMLAGSACLAADFGAGPDRHTAQGQGPSAGREFKTLVATVDAAPRMPGVARFFGGGQIVRGQAYARAVWMPNGASVPMGASRLSVGVASLNRAVVAGLSDPNRRATLAPVASMDLSETTTLTLIRGLGSDSGGMAVLQMKLGR